MTTVTGKVEIGPGRAPSQLTAGKSYVRIRVAQMVTTSAGVLMLPVVGDPIPLEADGSFTAVVDPVPAGYGYVFEFSIDNGLWKSDPLIKRVPSSGTYNLKDLDDLVPVGGPGYTTPGWYAQALQARDETQAAAARTLPGGHVFATQMDAEIAMGSGYSYTYVDYSVTPNVTRTVLRYVRPGDIVGIGE